MNPSAPPLFDEAPVAPSSATPEPVPARARLVATNAPDMADRQKRLVLLLVVDCPFCDHQHIHPGGRAGAPRADPRRSRCVGTRGGIYFFPEVVQ